MNDIDMVRDLLPEPPAPSERATGAAFRALEDEIAGRGARRTRRRLPFGRLQLGLTGLVAAGAAGTVAIATLGGGGPAEPRPGGGDASARSLLLAAAEQAAKEPAGRYWRVQTIDGQAYRVGKGPDGYTVLGYQSQWDRWTARSAADPDVLYARDLGARPLTMADAAAWRKAGAPRTMRVWSNDHWATLSTVPGETFGAGPGDWTADRSTPAEKKEATRNRDAFCRRLEKDGEPVPPADCQALKRAPGEALRLADDPAKLDEQLFPPKIRGTRSAATDLMSGFDFLTARPATPEIRAAAFRRLAAVAGVRTIGEVTDDRGRTGIGLAARGTMAEGSGTVFDYQLILEPGTYRILAGRKVVVKAGGTMTGMRPGDVLNRELVLGAGWTNESPRHP
ncbi:hypothetical protein [Actinomadura sp. 21ATH]|uniref:hypothetical protein n=1 Tax=Actinomadura sp. 21ATH TaxID=1735444 RepID=UPI0035BFA9E4